MKRNVFAVEGRRFVLEEYVSSIRIHADVENDAVRMRKLLRCLRMFDYYATDVWLQEYEGYGEDRPTRMGFKVTVMKGTNPGRIFQQDTQYIHEPNEISKILERYIESFTEVIKDVNDPIDDKLTAEILAKL